MPASSRPTFRRPSPALVVSVVALFAAMGGVSAAEQAVTSAVKKFHGKRIKNRTVTGKKIKAGTLRFTHFRAGELLKPSDAYGKAESDARYQPRGNYQPAGAYEPAGDYLAADGKAVDADRLDGRDSTEFADDADSLWAFVLTDGTVARSSGDVAASKPGEGTYEVEFPRPVGDCSYTATVSVADGGTPVPGQIAVGLSADADTVSVVTGNTTGAPADADFMLHVLC